VGNTSSNREVAKKNFICTVYHKKKLFRPFILPIFQPERKRFLITNTQLLKKKVKRKFWTCILEKINRGLWIILKIVGLKSFGQRRKKNSKERRCIAINSTCRLFAVFGKKLSRENKQSLRAELSGTFSPLRPVARGPWHTIWGNSARMLTGSSCTATGDIFLASVQRNKPICTSDTLFNSCSHCSCS